MMRSLSAIFLAAVLVSPAAEAATVFRLTGGDQTPASGPPLTGGFNYECGGGVPAPANNQACEIAVAEIRIGGAATFEQGINVPPATGGFVYYDAQQIDFQNTDDAVFRLTHDPLAGTGNTLRFEISITRPNAVQGQPPVTTTTVSVLDLADAVNTTPANPLRMTDAVSLAVRTRSRTDDNYAELTDLFFGTPGGTNLIPVDLRTNGGPGVGITFDTVPYLIIQDFDFETAWEFSGISRFRWVGTRPNGSNLGQTFKLTNLAFEGGAPPAVPVPPAALLLLTGLGLMATLRRGRATA